MASSLVVVSGIYPPDIGGPAKFAHQYASWVIQDNIKVDVYTYGNTKFVLNSITSPKIYSVSRSQPLLFRYIKMIIGIGTGNAPSAPVLVVGAFLETFLASLIFRFQYVAKVPGDIVWERARNKGITGSGIVEFQNEKLNLKYRLLRMLYSNSLRRAQKVIVPSKGLYDLCLGWGIESERIRLIYNSVQSHETNQMSAHTSVIDCLTICRLVPWKGVDEIIRYCASRNLGLVVAGDGPDRQRLEELATELGGNVTFTGEVSPESINQLLTRSRVFVLNSYYEGLPHALIEARLAGVLSVARAGTGSEEVIRDNFDGYLISPGRPLAETLDLAFASHLQSENFVTRAKLDTVTRFNQETNFAAIKAILECEN